VLIDSDQQKRRTLSTPITDDHIGQDFLIGMPDVRRRVSIIDCRSNEVFHLMELSLELHNKIAKITKTNNFTTRPRRPQSYNNLQPGSRVPKYQSYIAVSSYLRGLCGLPVNFLSSCACCVRIILLSLERSFLPRIGFELCRWQPRLL